MVQTEKVSVLEAGPKLSQNGEQHKNDRIREMDFL